MTTSSMKVTPRGSGNTRRLVIQNTGTHAMLELRAHASADGVDYTYWLSEPPNELPAGSIVECVVSSDFGPEIIDVEFSWRYRAGDTGRWAGKVRRF